MTDKIAEIRARHEAGAPGEMPIWALAQADADRATLLAEVERLRAAISTLEIVGKAADDERARLRAEVERLLETLRRIYDMSRPHTWRHVPREFRNETVLEIWQIVKQALEAKP